MIGAKNYGGPAGERPIAFHQIKQFAQVTIDRDQRVVPGS